MGRSGGPVNADTRSVGSTNAFKQIVDEQERGKAPSVEQPVSLEIDSLVLEGSPRLEGENEAHIKVLAEVGTTLPPILVDRATMRVVDGVHRVHAAKLRGEATISGTFFDGNAEESFVHAVRANISHGLPLTLADRRAAAERILRSYPEWSDRAIAAVTGLASATVGGIRTAEGAWGSNVRVGRDGRVRPLDTTQRRRRAAEVIAERPEASLREVASIAGISLGTAQDVRRRISNGEDVVAQGPRQSGRTKGPARKAPPRHADPSQLPRIAGLPSDLRTPSSILEELRSDPSLRYSETGRNLLRWLEAHLVEADHCTRVIGHVPLHSTYQIQEVAKAYATIWHDFANQLARRASEASAADA